MEALEKQQQHQYGQSSIGFHGKTTSAVLQNLERRKKDESDEQKGVLKSVTSATQMSNQIQWIEELFLTFVNSISLTLEQQQLMSATDDIYDSFARFYERNKLFYTQNDYVYIKTQPDYDVEPTLGVITMQLDGKLQILSVTDAKKLLAETQVDPDDGFFSIAGIGRAESDETSGSQHDESVYGDDP
jgi:hypothetical protein